MSDPSPQIQLSVALITRNHPELLNRCLESIRSQSVQPFQIVVSDDSSLELAPKTEAVAKQFNCLYITGPNRGLQANLNNAVLACTGTHIRIVNDDHIFPENHFQILQKSLDSDPDSVWTVGEYYENPKPTSTLHLPGEIQPRGFHIPITNFDDSFAISGGASIYPRKVFENHRFLEAFGYVCDLEFGPRLKALGYRIRYCPETYVIHLAHGTFDERFQQRKKIVPKGSFLTAYLTYGCYRKNLPKQVQCLSYFLTIALLTSAKIKDYYFNLSDFWYTWNIAKKYIRLFKAGEYDKII